ncbi:hypothetical protein PVK06_020011 [Gossypium arboreum]|uniref:DUF4283 domain-containing protein n=1 Tax=Gossypium arboreum TaxID=29729 RepID=A0ABR0PL89_GOSAR|nr:hypothetical protein PVK06_020011 [Gossypium arboreum]
MCYLWATMVEDINAQLGKLNFSEEESKRVFSLKLKSNDTQGHKTWVIEKIMGQEFEAFTFNISPFWVRVFNIPFHHMDREEAIKVGRAIGEVPAIDWHYKDGGWVNYIRLRKNGIEVIKEEEKLRGELDGEKNGNEEVNMSTILKEKDKDKIVKEKSVSSSPMKKQPSKVIRDALGKFKCKRKIIRGNNREGNEESPNRQVRRKLVDSLSLSKVVAGWRVVWQSWDILRSVGKVVREDWIVGGDFNAIVNDVEIDVGRKKARASMEEFKDVMEDLALVDVKMDKRCIDIVPFPIATVVQQNTYDYDAILLDTVGRKPSERVGDSRLTFKYDMC